MTMRPYCLTCDSGMIDRDDDPVLGIVVIRCVACGRRQYQGIGPNLFGMRETSGRHEPEMEENNMNKIGPCDNCGRTMSIQAFGCCYICGKAAKGLTGPARDAALADIKAKIERGEVKSGGGGKKRKKRTKATGPESGKLSQAASAESSDRPTRTRRRHQDRGPRRAQASGGGNPPDPLRGH